MAATVWAAAVTAQAPSPSDPRWNEAAAALAEADLSPTTGAAPGYVADAVCAACHQDLADSYAEVGMARSFARPESAVAVEDLSGVELAHEVSGDHFAMVRRDGRMVFARWRLDAAGQEEHRIEIPVDWVLGSGHTSRTYLFQTPNGELYQLPIAWYDQEKAWGMAPGFDRADHLGLQRRVARECMFCHNAYPDVPSGSDERSVPDRFPASLPEGIGCQRCHGPGAMHAGLALAGRAGADELRVAIVNPARLPPTRREDVCRQCHLQPSVALPGPRRLGRADYSFRPGEALSDYQVVIDVAEQDEGADDRFEINHHPYRLDRSACRTDDGRPLSCLVCHDPHRRVPPAERPRHYRQACLGCHEETASSAAHGAGDRNDCTSCHMPRRRTRDVVHAVMTDHRITRSPVGPEALGRRVEQDPVVTDARVLDPAGTLDAADRELYRTLAAVRAGASPAAARHLEMLLRRAPMPHPDALIDLAAAAVDLGRSDSAFWALERARPLRAADARALLLESTLLARRGELDAATAALRRTIDLDPLSPEAHSNLGVIAARRDDLPGAVTALRRAVELRPNLALAWYRLGLALERLGDRDGAALALRRALATEPRDGRAVAALARTLAAPPPSRGAAATDAAIARE